MPDIKLNASGLHILRNPHGWVEEDVRQLKLEACDIIENPILLEAIQWYLGKRLDFAIHVSRKESRKRDQKPFTEKELRDAWTKHEKCKVLLKQITERFLT